MGVELIEAGREKRIWKGVVGRPVMGGLYLLVSPKKVPF